MNEIKFRIKYKKVFIELCVLLAILMSKTYYFGIHYRSTFQIIFWTICFFAFFVAGKNYKSSAITSSFTMIVLMIINMLIFFPEMESNQINTVIGHILTILSVTILANIIDSKTFAYLYIKIISIFCLISIPCFIIAISNPELARQFCQPGYQWPDPAGYSPYYLWGINGMIHVRNSGPFWEPGAFQGFINFGILMLLYRVDDGLIKKRLWYFVILTFTALTTQSATGYLILTLIFFFQRKNIENGLLRGRYRKILKTVIFFTAIAIIVYIFSSNVISNKLAYSGGQFETVSATMRWDDIKGGLSLILNGNIFGLGETFNRDALKLQFGVNKDDSVGFMAMTYTYGIVFFFIYFFSMINGIINLFNPHKYSEFFLLVFVFIILHMTEGLWFLPVYLFIALFRKPEKKMRPNYDILHNLC